MPFIKKSFITETLLPNIDIQKYIGQFVSFKKSGANYVCCCPLHNEKGPSFNVSPSRQMFYCFGCHVGGNVIDFVMKYKNVGFVEAIEELAEYAGLSIEYESGNVPNQEQKDKYNNYYDLMDRAASLFTKVLKSKLGKDGLEYFKQKRQLTDETMTNCRLGFSPRDPHFLQENLCKKEGDLKALVDLGLIFEGERGDCCMFRNRVMIPIFDKKGRVISFGGRTLGDDKPKYLNTKENPIFKKRQELFGLYETLKANNNRPGKIVVVEGYMDVIALRQYGCTFAVASLGTATTQEQIIEMFRHTDKVVFCYDGDSAGRNAAWHAFETVTPILTEGKEVSFAFLPKEHDPDSLVREQGLASFYSYLDEAASYTSFLVLHQLNSYDISNPNQLSSMIDSVIGLISKIPVVAMQNVAIMQLSKSCGMSTQMLYDVLKKYEQKSENSKKSDFEQEFDSKDKEASPDGLKTPMQKLMAFIVQQPTVVSLVYHDFDLKLFVELCKQLKVKGVDFLENLLGEISKNPQTTPANLIEIYRNTNLEKIFNKLLNAPLNLSFQDGAKELAFEDKISVFSDILVSVLQKPFKDKADYYKLKLNQGNKEALSEYSLVQAKIFNNKK